MEYIEKAVKTGEFEAGEITSTGLPSAVPSQSGVEARGRPAFTWQDAEEQLGDAVEWLGALGDREGAFLAAGRSSSWPQVLRIEQSDYPDRPDPRQRLSSRQLAHVERFMLDGDAVFLAIPEAHRSLVGRVLIMKRFPERSGGFRWRYVREALAAQARNGERVPAPEALRKRYERAIGAVCQRLNGAIGQGLARKA